MNLALNAITFWLLHHKLHVKIYAVLSSYEHCIIFISNPVYGEIRELWTLEVSRLFMASAEIQNTHNSHPYVCIWGMYKNRIKMITPSILFPCVIDILDCCCCTSFVLVTHAIIRFYYIWGNLGHLCLACLTEVLPRIFSFTWWISRDLLPKNMCTSRKIRLYSWVRVAQTFFLLM